MTSERETRDRPGRSGWLLALGVIVALLLLGFVIVLLRGKGQPEAVSPGVVSEPMLSSLPSPTARESSMLSSLPSPTAEESPTAAPDTPVPTGPLAPDFTLPDLDGATWSLSQFRGRPVVLFFWATW